MMKQQGHFLLLEKSELRSWLAAQNIMRTITKLQVHHTASPNYTTRKIVNGVAQQDHFTALEGMRNYHVNTNGWSATGQNITTFEDGKIAISLDRDLNSTPAGIAGANTGALCIENIGNFDSGGDTMTDAQREAILYLYACLCEKLGLTPSVSSIVYHAWYKADGTWLGDYTAGKSSKTCPGTAWWGDGNSKAAAASGFIADVAVALIKLKSGEVEEEMTEAEKVAFTALQATVKEQATLIAGLTTSKDTLKTWLTGVDGRVKTIEETRDLEAPAWFVKEFGSADLGGLINTPTGDETFWRTIAIIIRAGKAGKLA